MNSQDNHLQQKLLDVTVSLVALFSAKGGSCFFEENPGIFILSAVSGFCEFDENKRPKVLAERIGFHSGDYSPKIHRGNSVKTNILNDNVAQGGKKISLLIQFPLVKDSKLSGIVELYNPEAHEETFTPKALNAVQGILKSVLLSDIRPKGTADVSDPRENNNDSDIDIISKSESIKDIITMISRIAVSDSTVLLSGETGTGKTLFAKYIHDHSNRCNMPFVKVNCAAIPESLLESEFFGHDKGAFTGALQRRIGKFERAHLGTIFLDEIGEIPLNLQSKLLNVLQDYEFERIGGSHSIKVNVRVLAATNKDLNEAVKSGEFREDLFYRLNVVPVSIPPLRSRIEDIEVLVYHFITKINQKINLNYSGVSDEVLFLLKKYDWPGNIRELENIIERAMVIGKGKTIQPSDLPQEIFGLIESVRQPQKGLQFREGEKSLWETEKNIIIRALRDLNWNQSKAARALGITRNHMRYRIKKYNIKKHE